MRRISRRNCERLPSRAKFVIVNREAIGRWRRDRFSCLVQDGVPIENGVSRGYHDSRKVGRLFPDSKGDSWYERSHWQFPAEYHASHLAGKLAHFEVTMKTVEEREIPAIDDELRPLGKFDSLEALKKNIPEGRHARGKKAALREERRGQHYRSAG